MVACRVPGVDRGDALGGPVEPDHDDIGASAVAERLDRAERHLVVLAEDACHAGVGLQEVGGDVQALGAVEVGGLLGGDGDALELLDALGEALAAGRARRRSLARPAAR